MCVCGGKVEVVSETLVSKHTMKGLLVCGMWSQLEHNWRWYCIMGWTHLPKHVHACTCYRVWCGCV